MLSAIRRRLTPSTVIATLALIFAMSGGAYAASKYLITSTKQISPKVLKALKGKPGRNGVAGGTGANGTTGPAGPAGATGPAGPAGPQGPPGANGANGEKGTAGTNGKEGKEGKQGVIHPGETLPSEASETGAWFGSFEPSGGFSAVQFAISFTIPLAAALPEANIQVNPESYDGTDNTGTEHEQCPGKASEPRAKAGFLCIYTTNSAAPSTLALPQVNTAAGVVESLVNVTGPGIEGADSGTWAVTAE
jgi:hypothetical protein